MGLGLVMLIEMVVVRKVLVINIEVRVMGMRVGIIVVVIEMMIVKRVL